MATAHPQSQPFSAIMADIEFGRIKIPQFQRDFVWSRAESARLLDSILKGYPIGTFILWNTNEQLRVVREIGGLQLPPTPPGNFTNLVLDGQQRLTSLYAALKGVSIVRDGRTERFGDICVDLLADPSGDAAVVLPEPPPDRDPHSVVRLGEIMEWDIDRIDEYPKPLRRRMQDYRNAFTGYLFSVVMVQGAPIEVATEIFTRLNVGGKRLSTFEIMVAKTFDQSRDFDLADRFKGLIERLEDADYGTISHAVVLQTVGAIQGHAIKAKDILALPRDGFIDTWPRAVDGIERAVDYFRNYFRIPVSQLLPYPHLLVPFAYFFAHHKDPPIDHRQALLQDLFWRVALTWYYSSSVESRLEADIKRVDQILAGVQPEYDVSVDASPPAVAKHGGFRAGSAWIKGILCLLAAQAPKSFGNNAQVRISNDWLKQANSKNYHHFFPRAWAAKSAQWSKDWRINHIANITIVDDFLNKRVIGAAAPSVYLQKFKANKHLAEALQSHLIDLDADGVLHDDWPRFWENRCVRISAALESRLLLTPRDAHGHAGPAPVDLPAESGAPDETNDPDDSSSDVDDATDDPPDEP